MTVTYTGEVATCRKFGSFLALLLRWRGSIYKLVWMDLTIFIVLFYSLSFLYHFGLNSEQKKTFENIVLYFKSYSSLIPLSFVLGFFVSIVMQRWWEQYLAIPWPDPIAVFVSAHIHGQDERARLMRRTIMRYVCLTQAMVFAMIAPKSKKRFPTMNAFVDVGLLLDNEKVVFDSMDELFPKTSKYWMPIVWAASIVTRARKEGRIRDDFAVKTIVDELNKFRGQCGTLLLYDYIPIPLVYTQVVTVAVYTFFLGCILGMQWTEANKIHSIDFYIPIFTILQFFFYMGWLKVAESLINPFGEDDDDFEVNWMIDRNLQVSYLIVDEMHQEHPDLVKDQYWDEVFPSELPYDGDAKREEQPEPSTTKLGERLAGMSNVIADRTSKMSVFLNLEDVQQSEGRNELMKRINSLSAQPSDDIPRSYYDTARESLVSIISFQPDETKTAAKSEMEATTETGAETAAADKTKTEAQTTVSFPIEGTPKTQPSTPAQRPEETPHRVHIFEGVYEVSDSDLAQSPQASVINKEPTEPESDDKDKDKDKENEKEKDDFERLKEERERERNERQKLRFVQRMEDATNLTFRRESRTSEHSWEIYGEAEGEEEEFFQKSNNTKNE